MGSCGECSCDRGNAATSVYRPVGSHAYNRWRARHLGIAPRMPAAPTWSALGGVFPAVAGDAVRSNRTVSTLPPTRCSGGDGGVLSVALPRGSPPPGVTRHRTSVEPGLSSPRATAESGHPTVWHQPIWASAPGLSKRLAGWMLHHLNPKSRGRAMPVVLGTDGFRFQVVDDWAKLPPGYEFNADVAAVGVDKNDNVYAFNRGAHPMIVFDRHGNFLRSLGEG